MIRFHKLSFILLLACMTGAVLSQEKKITVAVYHNGEDIVGQSLAFSVREAIRASYGYQLLAEPEAMFAIRIATLEPEFLQKGVANFTVAAVDFTMRNYYPYDASNPQSWLPFYLTGTVSAVGKNRVEEEAKSILADLDKVIYQYIIR